MRARAAYISSLGTTGILVGAALLMLATVGALVAFHHWPGGSTGNDVTAVPLQPPARGVTAVRSVAGAAAARAAAGAAVAARATGRRPAGRRAALAGTRRAGAHPVSVRLSEASGGGGAPASTQAPSQGAPAVALPGLPQPSVRPPVAAPQAPDVAGTVSGVVGGSAPQVAAPRVATP
jgi:hypothetical protein